MQVIHPRCAGIDIHKKTATVCVRILDQSKRAPSETRTFGTMMGDLLEMKSWLAEHGCTHVAIESTGVYWMPVFNVLEDRFTVVLANAHHVKAVPGRKTDVRDAEWLADLLQHGLIRGSFIPPAPVRELRELTRYRTTLVEDRTREINRIHKALEMCNIKLAAVASDALGASGRAMIEAIIGGTEDPVQLASLAKRKLRAKLPQLEAALTGRVQAHHRVLLRQSLDHIDFLDRSIAELDRQITERTGPFEWALKLLDEIPGVGRRVGETIIAEIGLDMSQFPGAKYLCSWAAICPGNRESAGKRLSGRTRHGNRYLRAMLVQAAWAASHVKDTYLGAQLRRLARTRGLKRALVAVAHTILTIVYHVLAKRTPYKDLGPTYFHRLDTDQLASYHTRRLRDLGFTVTLTPIAA
jgi:transposase